MSDSINIYNTSSYKMAEGNSQDLIRDNDQEHQVLSKKRKRELSKQRAIEKHHDPAKQLKLVGRGMESLAPFPKLLELEELDLSDNKLANDLEALIESTPKLSTLNLTGNKFADIESLKPLAKLESLHNLSVFDCPLTTIETYRKEIYELLPNLVLLDGFDKNEKEQKNNKLDLQEPTNSQGEKELNSSSEEVGETKIYKQFLHDKVASDDDESNDDDFDPSKDGSNTEHSNSESDSSREYSDRTSSQLTDSGQESQKESSEDEKELNEPSAKRTRTDSNED